MMIEVIVQPDPETTRQLFSRPWSLINFRAAARRACEQLEAEVKRLAPKATGEYRASIDCTDHEFDNPYRFVARVYSSHPAADAIEFGADPHTVPLRSILRWMQAVGMRIPAKNTVEDVAYRIQKKIEERGLAPHHVFTDANDVAEGYFHAAIDPILAALGGSAEYTVTLRSSGSRTLPWE